VKLSHPGNDVKRTPDADKKYERSACNGESDQAGSHNLGKNDIDVACQPKASGTAAPVTTGSRSD
jgi:hypothetical protein